jgi:diaminohydroxyphosphoribosylaminopyrimidine deaminase/5-amino-6-(5-phosphoribosylamino)uracil reductase
MNHEYHMRQALDLAKKGWPQVAPNPMVGCVIVKNNEVVSDGYHQKFGGPHAEVIAINNLPSTISPQDCIVYVTLEPCSHHGKTPPCAELIISKGFKTVVISSQDPNPLVKGDGIKKLEEAGIAVIKDILKHETEELNKHFFTFHEQRRPYFILKWAITAEGFISRIPVPKTLEENRITRREAQVYVHRMRSELMGIFVGKNTVLKDNPRLTTRLVQGKNPTRIFIDRNLEIPQTYNVYNKEAPTIIFNSIKDEEKDHLRFMKLDFNRNTLPQICEKLYDAQIQSVLVEGGAYLVNEFVNQELWDEVLVFQNPDLYFKQGLKGPVFALKNSFELVGDDKLYHHFKNEAMPAKGSLAKEIF